MPLFCEGCSRTFPEECINTVTVSTARLDMDNDRYATTKIDLCPLCALKLINKQHGQPEDTPFTGTKAKALHKRAVAHLKATGQEET